MNLLADSHEIITNILINKNSFTKSVNAFFQTRARDSFEIKNIIKIYLSFFKKYYYFEALTKELLTKATPSLITYLGVSLIYLRLYKSEKVNVIEFLKRALKNNKEKYNADIENILIDYSNNEEYELKNIKQGSFEYYSIVFNLPLWFIKMIFSQQNKENVKVILESFKTKREQYFLKSKLIDLEEINSEELKEFSDVDDHLFKTENFKSELISNRTFIKSSSFFEKIFKNKLRINNRYITLYQAEINTFYYRFLNEYLYLNNVLNIFVESHYENSELIKKVMPKAIKDLSIHESSVGELICYLGAKQDIIFYEPKSTCFEKFFIIPEYRVIFNQNSIDGLIKKQKEGLQEISTYLENNGKLIYLVETLDVKETKNVTKEFLDKNADFVLEKEECILPKESDKSIGYYAILKRVEHA